MLLSMPIMAQSLQKFIDKYAAMPGVEKMILGPEMLKEGFSKNNINIGPLNEMGDKMKCDSVQIISKENCGKKIKKFIKDAKNINIEADGYKDIMNITDDGDFIRILVRGEMKDATELVVIATDHDDNEFAVVRVIGKIDVESLMNQ